jgi:hypothetical protein
LATTEEASFEAGNDPLLSAPPLADLLVESERRPRPSFSSDRDRSPVRASLFWSPAQNLSTQPGDLSFSGESLDLAAPIWLQPGNVWIATGGVHRLEISTGAILPDSGLPVPDELWQIRAGVMHFRDLDNGWQAGGIFNVGSASDEPFGGLREMTANVIGFLKIPSGERNAWNFSVFYSPTSQLPFPLPGAAYVWNPNDQFTMHLGVPFSLEYRPTETRSFKLDYMPLTNVKALARQKLGDAWELYGGYEVTTETYFLDGRADRDERFFLFDQRLKLGLSRELAWGFSLDVSAAYLFDREMFKSDSFSGDRRDQLSIEPGVVGSVNISWQR